MGPLVRPGDNERFKLQRAAVHVTLLRLLGSVAAAELRRTRRARKFMRKFGGPASRVTRDASRVPEMKCTTVFSGPGLVNVNKSEKQLHKCHRSNRAATIEGHEQLVSRGGSGSARGGEAVAPTT